MTKVSPMKYQNEAVKTIKYHHAPAHIYLGIALLGELGEICNEYKKEMRNQESRCTQIIDEVGDVLWYLNAILHENGTMNFERMCELGEKEYVLRHQYNAVAEMSTLCRRAMFFGGQLADALENLRCESTAIPHYIKPVMRLMLEILVANGSDIEEAMTVNLAKLAERSEKGTIKNHA